MNQQTEAGVASFSRRRWWRPLGWSNPVVIVLVFVVFFPSLCLPCAEKGDDVSCLDGFWLSDAWWNSDSFSFPSTLMDFPAEDDGSEEMFARKYSAFKMLNGGVVSCASVDSESDDLERVDSREESLVSDVWETVDGDVVDIDTSLLGGSLIQRIEITPKLLDWGEKTLYSPSVAYLNVTNTCNESVLYVYEPFSSDVQFYAYNFSELSLPPGESASIAFIFSPRWLGSTSAHIVLQMNLGGFVIHGKGIGVESPFRVEPFIGYDISSHKRVNRKLSLYNPYDEVLYVEEVVTWVAASAQNRTRSSHAVCSIEAYNQSSGKLDLFLNDEEWFTAKQGINIRPNRQWEIPPGIAETVIELNLLPYLEGKVYGAICTQLRRPLRDRTETLMVPIEVDVNSGPRYSDLTGLVSVYFEPLVPFTESGSILSLSIKNDASQLLSVVKISEATETLKLFQVKYIEGLVLFPGTVTVVAFIRYTPQNSPLEIPSMNSKCMIVVSTNASAGPEIMIPCVDLVQTCCAYQPGSDLIGSEFGLISQQKGSLPNARTGSLGSIYEEPLHMLKPELMEVVGPDKLILGNWRSQATVSEMRVLKDRELLFPVVQIGTYLSKWITVHNPSRKPVIVQLLLNSEAVVDHCKHEEDSSNLYSFSNRFPHIDFIGINAGFSLPASAITEAFLHPSGIALLGPITFRPSHRCMWRNSALIRNNLSGVEWLPLRAFGGFASLVLLDGSKPVSKLEFNLDLPKIRNESSSDLLSDSETTVTSYCGLLLSKQLVAKNTGELPLEVKKVEISGTNCGLDGFMVDNCQGFLLAPGESVRLLVSYQTDFSTAVVHRDLELAMTSGILVIPMRANLPVYLISFCRKWFFFRVHWMLYLLLFAAISIPFLMIFRTIQHAFSSGKKNYIVKGSDTLTTIGTTGELSRFHHNTRNFRTFKEDEKSDAGSVSKYPNRLQDSSKRLEGRQCVDHQKKATSSPKHLTTRPTEFLYNSDVPERTQNAILTARGRRRKRTNAAGLASKFDASSSQSGNSTPSSPLSPGVLEISNHPFSRASEQNHEKNKDITEVPAKAENPKDEKLQVSGKLSGRILLPSATFPGPNRCLPSVTDSSFLALTSPIAPHARAPGSKLRKDIGMKIQEDDVVGKEFTYDIWGNYFSSNILSRSKELETKLFDASEADSLSFFTRDPQSS